MNKFATENKNPKSQDPVSDTWTNSHYRRMNMPVYEFECTNGHISEKLVPMGTKYSQCSKCKKKARKILSTCSFELKGGGWYADGYSSTKSKSTSKSD
jgi:putative FmdB family regulatory protein